MKLIIFDIDGTLIDSVQADDACFIQTFWDLHEIDLGKADWNTFQNVTDSGLTDEIFQTHFGRKAIDVEVANIKAYFYQLLHGRASKFREIKGALSFLMKLQGQPDVEIALATGGWRETAILKLEAIGFKLNNTTLASANEHFERGKIIRIAIQKSLKKNKLEAFEEITYVGDGLWDYKTSAELGIQFVGIDCHGNGKLKRVGAEKVFGDFEILKTHINY